MKRKKKYKKNYKKNVSFGSQSESRYGVPEEDSVEKPKKRSRKNKKPKKVKTTAHPVPDRQSRDFNMN